MWSGTVAEWNRRLAEHVASFPVGTEIVRVAVFPDRPIVRECLVPWEFSEIWSDIQATRVVDQRRFE